MTLRFPVVRLGDCLREPPSYGANAPALPYLPDLPRYVRITDIDGDGRLRSQGAVSIRREDADGCLLMAGDVLFARSGATVGKTYLHAVNGSECAFAGYLIRVRTAPEILLPEFLAEYLRTSTYRQWISRIAHAGAQPNISAREYADLPLPCPSIAEQRRIVEVLSPWKSGAAQAQALLHAGRSLMRGLRQEMLAGKRRLKRFERQPWTRARIGDLVSEIWRPVTWDESRTYNLTSVRRNAGGLFSRGSLEGRSIKVKRLFELQSGDLLVSHIQAAYGAFGLVTESFDGTAVSDLYSVLAPTNGLADAKFLAHVFRQPRIWHLARLASNGFFAERLRLNFSPADFLNREILVPPTVAEQRMIAGVLDLVDKEIVLLEQLREALDRQRRGVAELLLTGKIRTPA